MKLITMLKHQAIVYVAQDYNKNQTVRHIEMEPETWKFV